MLCLTRRRLEFCRFQKSQPQQQRFPERPNSVKRASPENNFENKLTLLEKSSFQTWVFQEFRRCLHLTQQMDWKHSVHWGDSNQQRERLVTQNLKIGITHNKEQ